MIFNQEKKDKIAQILESKLAGKPCEKCHDSTFDVMDGYFQHPVTDNLNEGVSKAVSSFAIICDGCGHLSFFAAKSILPDDY